jgi:cell division protein FtsI/penicillin-binding protein 2
MNTEVQRARRRQMFIFLLVFLGIGILLARLYYWQVSQSQSGYKLAQLANLEHTQNTILGAPRGLIYDIQGHILATNVVRDDVYAEPLQFTIEHPDNTQSALAALINTLHQVLPKVTPEKLQGCSIVNCSGSA